MKSTTITLIMGMTALAVFITATSLSAAQTGTVPVPAQDASLGNFAPGSSPLAGVQLVRHGRGRFHSGFGLYLGFGGFGPYYYRGYPYWGYGYPGATGSTEPVCQWNGYKYTCYDNSGTIIEQ